MSRKTLTARSARVFSPAVLMLLPLLLGASSTGEPEPVIEIGLTRAFDAQLRRSAEGIRIQQLQDGIRVRVAEGDPGDLVLFTARIRDGRVVDESTSQAFGVGDDAQLSTFQEMWVTVGSRYHAERLYPQTDVFLTSDRVHSGAMVAADKSTPLLSSIKKLIPTMNGTSSADVDGIYLVALPANPKARSSASVRPMLFLFDAPR